MHLATCPAEADLLRLFRENLPETEVAAVEEHVLHCGPCLEKLKTLAGTEDSLADLLRRHTPTPDFAASPVVAELMKQLKSLRASSASPESQGVAMIPLTCTACRKKLKVKAELAGKKIKCPGCGQVLAVGVPAPVAAPTGGSEDRTVLPTPEPASQAPPAEAGRRQTQAGASMFEATREHGGEAAGPNANLTDFLSPPQSGDELGRLGKYRILKVMGHGGMGVVYKAEDPVLKRTVAIKAMLPGVAAGASAGQRFLREAQTMAAVEHDHIVRIHDVAEERGVPFLAMEFLKGEPLDVRLERDGKLAAEETVRIGREIAAGLQAAHERGPDSPRHQAGQRLAGSAARARQDPGFRSGAFGGAGIDVDAARGHRRHAVVHGSRAGARRPGGRAFGPVQPGGGAVSTLLGPAAVPGPGRHFDADGGGHRRAAAAHPGQSRAAARIVRLGDGVVTERPRVAGRPRRRRWSRRCKVWKRSCAGSRDHKLPSPPEYGGRGAYATVPRSAAGCRCLSARWCY